MADASPSDAAMPRDAPDERDERDASQARDASRAPDEREEPAEVDSRESAYELFQRGSRLLVERHPGAAAVVLERCLALEPGKASILEALGRAYYNNGEPALAAERFGAIVEANPLAHYAHFGLGLSKKRLGDRAAARLHLKMAAFLKPEIDDYQRALQRLGEVA